MKYLTAQQAVVLGQSSPAKQPYIYKTYKNYYPSYTNGKEKSTVFFIFFILFVLYQLDGLLISRHSFGSLPEEST